MTTAPFWLEQPLPEVPARASSEPVDVVVVGGGVTGCSCALTLARRGLRVRLLEAREVAGGASGRNGGFALRGLCPPYDEARETLGRDAAGVAWELTERTLDTMAVLAGAALRRDGSLRLAVDAVELDALRSEYEALREDGFAAEWLHPLPDPLQRLFAGGLAHPGDGSLAPALWVKRLGALAAAAGAEIVERHPVDRETIDALDAGAIVIAVDGSTGELLPELGSFVAPVRGQMLASEPLPELLYARPHYARWAFDYWQQLPDRRLILGGGRDTDLDNERTSVEETTPVIQSRLDAFAVELAGYPPRITHRWAGIWGETPDRLPLAGRVPGSDRLWLAGVYSGHGNVLGFACGDLVAKAIVGEPAPQLAVFDPARAVAA